MDAPDSLLRPRLASVATVFVALASVALALWMLGHVIEAVLLAFAGVLFGLFLRGAGAWIAARVGLRPAWGVGAVAIALLAAIVAAFWLAADPVAQQAEQLAQAIPQSLERLRETLGAHAWGRHLLDEARRVGGELARSGSLARAGGVLSSALGALVSLLLVTLVGLFVAFDAPMYRDGVARLAPPSRRARARFVLGRVAHALRMWMLGKMISMAAVGVLTWVGLSLLGVPLSLVLTLLAAALTFVPNFGPVISAVPAVLLGLMESPSKAAQVAGLYLAVQTVESYVLTPLVQRRTTSLPPALTLLAQTVMGTLAGGLGVVVATPLTAAALVLVKHLYVEDVLGDRPSAEADAEG
ncbi:MAG: AI-2E family transporter [Polyangiales bacterium]